jgi:hypothetical protein
MSMTLWNISPNRNSQITGWITPIASTSGWRARARSLRPVRYQVSWTTAGT